MSEPQVPGYFTALQPTDRLGTQRGTDGSNGLENTQTHTRNLTDPHNERCQEREREGERGRERALATRRVLGLVKCRVK